MQAMPSRRYWWNCAAGRNPILRLRSCPRCRLPVVGQPRQLRHRAGFVPPYPCVRRVQLDRRLPVRPCQILPCGTHQQRMFEKCIAAHRDTRFLVGPDNPSRTFQPHKPWRWFRCRNSHQTCTHTYAATSHVGVSPEQSLDVRHETQSFRSL